MRPRAPLQLTLNITGRCPLDCQYCYAQPFTQTELSPSTIKRLLAEAEALGVFLVKIAGGEPLVHTEIGAVLDLLPNRRSGIAILSSVGIAPRRLSRVISYLGTHREINLQISLDSPDVSVNDSVRGRSELVLSNIGRCIEAGLDIQLATVLTTRNIETAERTVLEYFPRVRRFHFMNVMPTLKLVASGQFAALKPSEDELTRFWSRLGELQARIGPELLVADAATSSGIGQSLRYDGCSAAVTFCEIDSNGDVLACNISRSFVLGNIHNATLSEIWNSRFASEVAQIPVPLCGTYLRPDSPYKSFETAEKWRSGGRRTIPILAAR